MTDQNTRWLLAGLASVGVIGTGILSAKASFRAADMDLWYLPWKEKLKRAGPLYIPAALVAAGTISCIIGGNVVADHAEAGLVMAAGVYAQNRERLTEVFRKDNRRQRFEVEPGEVLWFDATLRDDGGYFGATIEEFVVALYEINRLMQVTKSVSYAEFYRLLGIRSPRLTDDKGWSIGAGVVYGYEWIDVSHDLITLDDGLECHVIRFAHDPTYDYLDYMVDEDKWQGWTES